MTGGVISTCAMSWALLGTATTFAAQDVSVELAACRAQEQESARLACYDRLADTMTKPKTDGGQATDPQREEVSAPAKTEETREATAESAAPPAPDSGTQPAAAAGSSPHERFGYRGGALAREDSTRQQQEEEETAAKQPLIAKVTEVARRPRGELAITLDNGQTWVQKKADRFDVKYGDEVRIEPGRLGAYMMYRAGSNRPTRVTRIR